MLTTIRTSLDWAVPIAAIAGAVALLLGLVAHPRKADAVFGIGMFCIIAGVAVVLLGYVVPVFLLPGAQRRRVGGASSRPSPRTPCRSCSSRRSSSCAGGLALMIAAAAARRRRAWSSPVPVHRYARPAPLVRERGRRVSRSRSSSTNSPNTSA